MNNDFIPEYPGLSVSKIKKEETFEEIQSKISDLQSRLNFAYRTSNVPLQNQLQMVLNTYRRAYHELLDEMYKSGGVPGEIDIS